MAAKEDLIHDINIVTTLSSKQDMSVPSCARKYLNYYEQNKVFKTGVGHHYLERLKLISEGFKPDTCFACKKNKAYDGILCEACMHKYTRGIKHFYKAPEPDAFSSLDEAFADDSQGVSSGSNISGTINNVGTSNLSPGPNSNNSQGSSFNPKDYSAAGKAAVVLSIFPTFPIGFIFALIDLSKKDGRKHGNAKAAIILSCIWIIGIAGVLTYNTIVKPPSSITTESNRTTNNNSPNSNNNTKNNNTSGNNGSKSANTDPRLESLYTKYHKQLVEKYNSAMDYIKRVNFHSIDEKIKIGNYMDTLDLTVYADYFVDEAFNKGLSDNTLNDNTSKIINDYASKLITDADKYTYEVVQYFAKRGAFKE